MLDRERFMKTLLGLVEVFGEPPMSEFRILAYVGAMEPFSDDQVERAMNEAARSLRFFPKPVELVELIEGKREDRALAAWEQLQQAVRRAGAYQSVLFEDPKIARVIKILGGWEGVCNWPVAELQYRRHEFLDAYKALSNSCPQEALAGIADRTNAAIGYQEAPPVFIGRKPPSPALPEPSKEVALPPGEDDRVPIGKVMQSINEGVQGKSTRDGWLLKH